nr:hypothetical protein [Tanacetum cinerariifolium]
MGENIQEQRQYNDPEQAQRDKDMKKSITLIAKYFTKIYKPTNNDIRTSSNSSNKNVDSTPRTENDRQTGQFGNQRTVKVAGTRETVGAPLSAEQSEWLQDTDEESDEKELVAHYMYMSKIQEVLQVTDDNYGPTYDTEPLEHVPTDNEYNVFASEQPKFINDTYVMEMVDSNVIPDHSYMCNNEFEKDQNADDNDEDELVELANLIANLKLDTYENKKIQKQLRKVNATLTHELNESKYALTEQMTFVIDAKVPFIRKRLSLRNT